MEEKYTSTISDCAEGFGTMNEAHLSMMKTIGRMLADREDGFIATGLILANHRRFTFRRGNPRALALGI
jgi:hypothetical protein